MIRHILAGLALLGVLAATDASAQAPATVKLCVQNGTTCVPVASGTPLPVSGGASPFVPSLSYSTLTATAASSASTPLPTNTGTVAFQNQNTVAVSCTLASGSATATTNEIIVPGGSTIFVGTTGYSNAACINQTGSASNVVIMAGGSGLGTGFGGGGSSGNGLVQTSPPSYTNATSQPLTLNAQGALPAASLNLGAFTCSALCSTTNRTLLSANTFGYTTFSIQQTATDNSLIEIDVSYDGGTTWSQLPVEIYGTQGATPSQGQLSNFPSVLVGYSACARIPNPGGLVRVFVTAWNSGTITEQAVLSNSDSCAKPTIIASGSYVALSDLNGNSSIPPVVCGSAVSSCVLKNSAGFLYGVYANCTAACWLMVFNATSAPSNGATTAGIAASNMQECIPIPANGSNGVNYLPGPPSTFSTGITAVISSTPCATLTLATTGFIHGVIR